LGIQKISKMNFIKNTFLLISIPVALASCVTQEEAVNNVRVVYNPSGYELLSVDEYVYDDGGKLYATRSLTAGQRESRWSLPPGRYTVVAWGNHSDRSRTECVDVLEQARVAPAMRHQADGSVFDRGDSLLYGYGVCTAPKAGPASEPVRLSVGMEQAYSDFIFTVRRNQEEEETGEGDYFFRLEGMAPHTPFAPRDAAGEAWDNETVTYRCNASNEDGQILGARFITHRMTADSHPVVSLWKGNRQIMNGIDLSLYFRAIDIDPGERPEQVYELNMEIQAEAIVVSSFFGIVVVDWKGVYISTDLQ
jgi:hypothetical protein